MTDCTGAVFYPSEEGAKFKIMFGESPNSQKHRRSSKLCKPDFKPSQTVQQNFVEFHYWQNWQTDSWIILSRLVAPTANLLTTDVLRLCIMCGNNNAIADQAWATKLSEAWDPTTFFDKYDIMVQTSAIPRVHISGHTAIQVTREIQTLVGSTEPCDFKGTK